MAGIFVGAPAPVALPPAVDRWSSCQHTWTCDGKTWDLTSLEADGVFLLSNLRGVNESPPITHYLQTAAAIAGSRWKGFRADNREVFWPLLVARGDGSQAWLDFDAELWSTFEPDKVGVWSVTQPGTADRAGETRTLQLRFKSEGDPPETPELLGWAEYGVYLQAEQPYWAGPKIRDSWANTAQSNFYGGGPVGGHGYGPPFFIGSAASLSRAQITNPGPLPGRPVWSVFGPSTSASLGVDGKHIGIPFSLGEGDWLRIDTHSSDQRALFGSGAVLDDDGQWSIPADALAAGTNRTRELATSTRFGTIPGRGTSDLEIVLAGQGTVTLELEPLYYRDH